MINKKIALPLILLVFLIINTSCSKEDIIDALKEITCTLVTNPSATVSKMEVTYEASKTGDGRITLLTYADETGNIVTVENPKLPWSKKINMEAGKTIAFGASAITLIGSVTIKYTASDGVASFTSSDHCSQSK